MFNLLRPSPRLNVPCPSRPSGPTTPTPPPTPTRTDAPRPHPPDILNSFRVSQGNYRPASASHSGGNYRPDRLAPHPWDFTAAQLTPGITSRPTEAPVGAHAPVPLNSETPQISESPEDLINLPAKSLYEILYVPFPPSQ
ncbi:proline-rich receptor-like protein kinase PERK9 [Penaeus monodon]|uniref:proline-rich receptor-like protein kinase PERK9 n=1 Tax=Penaeus monodon TaxID=6687 RepID=UPI0018A7235E|nr:proline-rich receptor-like protein kinase PERK9 [Penaeus monodon]